MVMIHIPVQGKKKSADLCAAFAQGAPRSSESFVFYGVDGSNINVFRTIMRAKINDFYYIDNSYFDSVRGAQYRVTKNRLQVKITDQPSDGKRFDALGLTIKPWRPVANRKWLVVKQSDYFMREVVGDPNWVKNIQASNPTVLMTIREWNRDKLRAQATIDEAILQHDCVATHSSAAAISAVLLGTRVVISPVSALFGMVTSQLPRLDERYRFLSVCADNQFTIEELKSGHAWSVLNP